VAIGDALGMPAEFLTPNQIRKRFGVIKKFYRAPKGHPNSFLKAGQVTDDTRETLVVANCLIKNGRITAKLMADEFIRWAKNEDALKLPFIGPSTKIGIKRLLSGENPRSSGRDGTTNGACMRVSPVGIANAGEIEKCISETAQACMPTHGTSIAISGASAVSCAISEAMKEGATVESVIEAAIIGAKKGGRMGIASPAPSVHRRIEMALKIVGEHKNPKDAARELYEIVGTGLSPAETVPSAIGIFAACGGKFREGIIIAANAGGDTDTLASIVGAITGAFTGIRKVPQNWFEIVERVNSLNLKKYSEKLFEILAERSK